ncbi:MAG TPA: Clp protease N-terminal domain-containing protein [Ktedonobacteraceae bacterium]|nr:Clp protease N-terminal domain-containing protein [Ktedonobacteraceae bacterium]
MEALVTSDEVAAFLRVDVVTIRRLVSRGELAAYRVGSEFRFAQKDLDDFLQRQRVPAGEESSERSPLDLPAPQGKGKNMDRFDRFTRQARRVLSLAQEEAAVRFRHNFIGTEHLLLGLMRENEGCAAQVLSSLHVDIEQARDRLKSIVEKGKKPVIGSIGLTRRAKKVIELAVDEAKKMGHQYVTTGHLLIGLLREGEGIGADILRQMGLELEPVRQATLNVLSHMDSVNSIDELAIIPPVPAEASALLPEGEQGSVCKRCGAHSLVYFHYCFNCGLVLNRD